MPSALDRARAVVMLVQSMDTKQKRKLKLQSRKTILRGASGKKLTGLIHNEIAFSEENILMHKMELEQTKVDMFWGFDKEAKDRQSESVQMSREDVESTYQSHFHKFEAQKRKWEEEYEDEKFDKAYQLAVVEENERHNYMRHFFSINSSDDVMRFQWRSRAHQQSQEDSSAEGPNRSLRRSSDMSIRPQYVTMTNHRDKDTLTSGESAASHSHDMLRGAVSLTAIPVAVSQFPLPGFREEVALSLHLDGLQQARSLTDATGHIAGASLRTRSSMSVADAALQPESILAVRQTAPVKTLRAEQAEARRPHRFRLRPCDVENVPRNLLTKAPVVPALEGHELYKWDQELVLRVAFAKLCPSATGGLGHSDMMLISQNAEVHALLKYTVFGARVKRKQWLFFYGLVGPSGGKLTVSDWVNAARVAAQESSVSLRHIRTDAEHKARVQALEKGSSREELLQLLDSQNAGAGAHLGSFGWFAELARTTLHQPQRDGCLRRMLRVGDCVWGLHDKGVVWLPAVIAGINMTGTSATYDLAYPLTHRSLQKLRMQAATRQLLDIHLVANKHLTASSHKQTDKLVAVSGAEERRHLDHAFDAMDHNRAGALPLSLVLATLKSPDFTSLVTGSGALSAVLGAAVPVTAGAAGEVTVGACRSPADRQGGRGAGGRSSLSSVSGDLYSDSSAITAITSRLDSILGNMFGSDVAQAKTASMTPASSSSTSSAARLPGRLSPVDEPLISKLEFTEFFMAALDLASYRHSTFRNIETVTGPSPQ